MKSKNIPDTFVLGKSVKHKMIRQEYPTVTNTSDWNKNNKIKHVWLWFYEDSDSISVFTEWRENLQLNDWKIVIQFDRW